jgi:Kelch motif protein
MLLLTFCFPVLAQKLTRLKNQSPDGAGIGFQLTDGTLMFQGGQESDWYKLTPDINGSYLNGTWTRLANLPPGYVPDAFASAVLADGRLVIVGGEYNNGAFVLTNMGAIYDPKANTWTTLAPPSFWPFIGDSPSAVLPDGKFLVGNKLVKQTAYLDPKTLTWTKVSSAGKSDFNAEEGWTLMPDGTVLTYDVKNAPNAEKYIPSMRKWVNAGNTIVDLHSPSPFGCLKYGNNMCYFPPGEVGPAILRPDGTVFATGSTPSGGNRGHTAIYTPGPNPTDPGTWAVGPDFPLGDDAGDNFAALLPNGNVLVASNGGKLYEFDGTNLSAGIPGGGSLMVVPTGEIIVGGSELYTTTGTFNPAWAPTISTAPTTVTRGSTFKISGTQFNGLSQAAGFGDELETATNYPLVRITNKSTGHVFYAKTHDHSTMAVATGNAIVSTNFDVPATAETGASSLEVVANGIPSAKVNVTVN